MKIPRTTPWLIPAVLALGILFLFGKPLQSIVYGASRKVQGVIWKTSRGISLFVASVPRAVSVAQEYETLKQERDLTQRTAVALEQTQKDNDALRLALSFQKNLSYRHIATEPIGREIARDVLIINKGKRQGIRPGMPVITASLALVGTVIETETDVSRVLLLSSPSSSFDAHIPQKNISGVVKGATGAALIFDLIAREATIEQGDVVVTNAFSGSLPQYLVLGTVTHITRNDAEPFGQATLKAAYEKTRIGAPLFVLQAVSQTP